MHAGLVQDMWGWGQVKYIKVGINRLKERERESSTWMGILLDEKRHVIMNGCHTRNKSHLKNGSYCVDVNVNRSPEDCCLVVLLVSFHVRRAI